MKHEEMQALVSAYYDGAVTPEERARVEAHLAECAACAAALAAYHRLGRAVQTLPRGVPSRPLWLRIREGLGTPIRRPLWLRLAPLASAVAVLVVGVTLVLVLSPGWGQRRAWGPAALPQAGGTSTPAALVLPPSATAPPLGVQGLVPDRTADAATGGLKEGIAAPCAGQPLALDLVGLSVRSNPQRTTPRLQGVLYDAQGQPLPGVLLVISGTAGWQGSTSTAVGGSFALDLPAAGTYQVVLALAPTVPREGTVDAAQARAPAARAYEVALPDGQVCLSPGSSPAPVPFTLAAGEEAVLTLRSR